MLFKVSNTVNQTLDAVSVAIQSPNSNMTIRIYTNNSVMSKPTDGTLKHTQEVSNTTAGIFTIPLSNKVNLTKGSYYSIVVDVWSSGKEANLYLDGVSQLSDGRGNSVYFYNQADYNQSFWTRGEYGDNWQDLNATGMQQDSEGNKYGNNWRIKGLANPVEGEEIKYTVDFNLNGKGSYIEPQQIKDKQKVTKPADPVATGYTFGGWYKDSQLTKSWDFENDVVTSNITLYAKWNAVTYTITYNANGGSISKSSITKTYGTNVNLDTPTRSGYKFEGWYKDSNLATSYDGKTDLANTQGANVTIYAKWSAVTYTITYNTNGGTISNSKVTKTYGENVSLTTPTRSGYTFNGWYKDSSLSTPYDGKTDLANTQGANVTIHAKWTAEASNTSSSNKNNGGGGSSGGSRGGSSGGSSGGSGGSGGSSSKGAANLNVNLPNNTSSTSEYQVGTTVDSVTGITLSVTKNATDGSIEAVSTNPITGVIQKVIVDAVTGIKNTSININFSQKPIAYTNSTSTWITTSDGKWKLSMMNQLGQISQPAEQWACVNSNAINADGTTSTVSNFYFFDSKGEMLTGWLTDITGKTYFLETAQTNDIGKMTRGWKVINNKYYYFSGDGVLVRNGVSDDGYALDANGEWKN